MHPALCLLNALCVPLAPLGGAQRLGFANPLDVKVADPDIIRVGSTYYLYGTAADPRRVVEGFPVWTSEDLVAWRDRGLALRNDGDRWGQYWFWGPDLVRRGKSWLMYYGAFGQADGHPAGRICVARSRSPLGPFVDVKAPMFAPSEGSAIDAEAFTDEDGRAYLYYTMSLAGRNTIWVAPLTADGLALASPPVLILQPDQPWETYPVNEGAFVMRRGATYVLLYSANDFRSADYAVGYATAPSPLGPWRKAPRNPVLAQSSRLRGPGCLGLVPSPDGAELWAYYHVHVARDGYLRQLAIDRAQVVPDAEMGVRVTIAGPTESTQALPAGAPEFPVGTSDEFGGALNPRRWEVIDEAPGAWAVRDGKLHLLTLDGDMFQGRADYRNLFLQRAPQGDFAITARAFVSSGIEYEQAFICVWQDADNYLRLSSTFAGRRVLDAAIEVDGQYVSTQQPQPGAGPVELRITRRGDVYSFAYRETGPAWVEVGPPRTAAFSDLKMGLGAISPGSTQRRPAWFDYFRLTAPGGAEP